jgi:hypothetical protein
MYKNDVEMGKRHLTTTVKVWRVWQGRQMLPVVAATTSKLVLESTRRYVWTILLPLLKRIHECCLISRDHNYCHVHDKNNQVNIKIVLG